MTKYFSMWIDSRLPGPFICPYVLRAKAGLLFHSGREAINLQALLRFIAFEQDYQYQIDFDRMVNDIRLFSSLHHIAMGTTFLH